MHISNLNILSPGRYYLATSRELKRIDAVTRSPIFAWFSESLSGTSTIRAFHQQSIFIAANQRRIDHNQICYLPSISVNRWLSVRLEFVGAMIIVTVAFLAMSALITTGVDAGLVGLVLSYALNTTSSLVCSRLFFGILDVLMFISHRTGSFALPVRLSKILSVWSGFFTRRMWSRRRPKRSLTRSPAKSGQRKELSSSGSPH